MMNMNISTLLGSPLRGASSGTNIFTGKRHGRLLRNFNGVWYSRPAPCLYHAALAKVKQNFNTAMEVVLPDVQ